MISWLVVLSIAGFFVMVGLRIVPVYLEHYSVKQVLASLKQEPFISRKPVAEIRKMLVRRLDINSVQGVTRDNIEIHRSGGVTKVEVKYEQRRPIAGNLDVIMSFDDSIDLIAN